MAEKNPTPIRRQRRAVQPTAAPQRSVNTCSFELDNQSDGDYGSDEDPGNAEAPDQQEASASSARGTRSKRPAAKSSKVKAKQAAKGRQNFVRIDKKASSLSLYSTDLCQFLSQNLLTLTCMPCRPAPKHNPVCLKEKRRMWS